MSACLFFSVHRERIGAWNKHSFTALAICLSHTLIQSPWKQKKKPSFLQLSLTGKMCPDWLTYTGWGHGNRFYLYHVQKAISILPIMTLTFDPENRRVHSLIVDNTSSIKVWSKYTTSFNLYHVHKVYISIFVLYDRPWHLTHPEIPLIIDKHVW